MITEYIKRIDLIFEQLLFNTHEVKDKFSLNAARISDPGSWSSYYRYSGLYHGLSSLRNDYHALVNEHPSNWSDTDAFLEFIIHWMEEYRFDNKYRDEYGECSIETLINLKQRIINALKKKNLGELERKNLTII